MPKLIYLGGGFLPGVPACDLDAEAVELFDEAVLLASGLYRLAEKPAAKKTEETEEVSWDAQD